VLGVHGTQIFSLPAGDPAEFAGLSEKDMGKVQFLQWFNDSISADAKLQATIP
jgi:hypothetical protein